MLIMNSLCINIIYILENDLIVLFTGKFNRNKFYLFKEKTSRSLNFFIHSKNITNRTLQKKLSLSENVFYDCSVDYVLT